MQILHTITDQAYAPLFHEWMKEHLGVTFDSKDTRYIASVLAEDGLEIVGCTALNRWTEGACEAHAASDGSKRQKIDRRYIHTVFDYAFRHADKSCLLTYVSVDNVKSLALQEMLGFTKVGFVPSYYGEGKDAQLFSMTKQQWLDGKWGTSTARTQE